MKDFQIYANGLCNCSVCSSLSLEETTERLNREDPTGIESKWVLSKEKFATGESNPCPCNTNPETHQHYLFEC